jgi:hypothetical protein
MYVMSGKVVDGKIVVEGAELAEGTRVKVMMCEDDDEPVVLSDAQREALLRSVQQADRGELIDARAFLEQLRRNR